MNDECFKSCMPRLCEDGDLLSVPFLRVLDNSLAFIYNGVDRNIAGFWRVLFISRDTYAK